MNSDPHESAAWRTFGMLDADEAAGFDEAIRHDPELRIAYQEMDCLAAAIAATTTVPVKPRPGQLERLHARLGLNLSKPTNWLGISGWAAAAALTLVLVLDRPSSKAQPVVVNPPATVPVADPGKTDHPASAAMNEAVPSPQDQELAGQQETTPTHPSPIAVPEFDDKPIVKVETKRLIQEIEVLRDKLENFQERDRKRFEPVAGMAWPIVMRMVPPGTPADPTNDLVDGTETPPLTAVLGDALTAANSPGGLIAQVSVRGAERSIPKDKPSAIPIYDAARDTGTLVVSNLPSKTTAERFNLWVKTDDGGNPVYVGRLPESNNIGTEPFDFSLGATGIVPSAFILTKDSEGDPVIPTAANTILQGPN